MRGDVTDFSSGWRQDRWETKLNKLRSSLWFYATGSNEAPVMTSCENASESNSLEYSDEKNLVPFIRVLNELELEIGKWSSKQ